MSTSATLFTYLLPSPLQDLLWRVYAPLQPHLPAPLNNPTSLPNLLFGQFLPPLLALFLFYLALLTAYNVARSTVRFVWWTVKWGVLLGVAVALWAVYLDLTGQADGARDRLRMDTAGGIPYVDQVARFVQNRRWQDLMRDGRINNAWLSLLVSFFPYFTSGASLDSNGDRSRSPSSSSRRRGTRQAGSDSRRRGRTADNDAEDATSDFFSRWLFFSDSGNSPSPPTRRRSAANRRSAAPSTTDSILAKAAKAAAAARALGAELGGERGEALVKELESFVAQAAASAASRFNGDGSSDGDGAGSPLAGASARGRDGGRSSAAADPAPASEDDDERWGWHWDKVDYDDMAGDDDDDYEDAEPDAEILPGSYTHGRRRRGQHGSARTRSSSSTQHASSTESFGADQSRGREDGGGARAGAESLVRRWALRAGEAALDALLGEKVEGETARRERVKKERERRSGRR